MKSMNLCVANRNCWGWPLDRNTDSEIIINEGDFVLCEREPESVNSSLIVVLMSSGQIAEVIERFFESA